jgi:hypothetical protein
MQHGEVSEAGGSAGVTDHALPAQAQVCVDEPGGAVGEADSSQLPPSSTAYTEEFYLYSFKVRGAGAGGADEAHCCCSGLLRVSACAC